MALAPRQRWFVLGTTLALTVGLAAWLGNGPEEPAEAPPAATPAPAADKAAGPVQSGRVGRLAAPGDGTAGAGGEIADIFAPQSWRPVPEPQAAAAAAPAAPQAPVLPFTYFGKLIDGRRVTVYLTSANRNLAVHRGDVIDGTWRVESIGPTTMVFRYLPLGEKLSLAIGRAK